jgi:hypothetical protein
MDLQSRIKAFTQLGLKLKNLGNDQFQTLSLGARNQNPWFTEQSVRLALEGIIQMLHEDRLVNWVSAYRHPTNKKKVAIIMAGNIPMVGFHDLLSTVVSGHVAVIKLSSKDQYLMNYLIGQLITIEPRLRDSIIVAADQIRDFDAVIATGSDNTSRYFDYYFGKYPNIIRRNRTSVAVLTGDEDAEQLIALGSDVFNYYGLGCRNISKLYVPEGFTFDRMLSVWQPFDSIIHHHKYCNNYDYQKSILLINMIPFLDNGFVLLQESEKLVSPISVVYYQFYKSIEDVTSLLAEQSQKIQVVAGHAVNGIPFGSTQCPQLTDYADNIDTMEFLSRL